MIELSADQKLVLESLIKWLNDPSIKKYITLGGYAGTGKTTLLAFLRKSIFEENPKSKIAFCSYTGKATQVLKRKLNGYKAFYKGDFIGTIHSLIYQAIEDDKGAIVGWLRRGSDELTYDFIIVDEASMVDEKIWEDLLSFDIPIIAVGDHGQLPPISQTNFNLMKSPELKLEKIHRQAYKNPIIQISKLARETGEIPIGNFGANVEKISFDDAGGLIEELFSGYKEDTLFLCGYNSTRVKINNAIRGALGFENILPSSGDRVICLRNNREKGIFNGMLGTILDIKPKDAARYEAHIQMDDDEPNNTYEGIISVAQFNSPTTLNNINGQIQTKGLDLFDFGYALTVHKAQGSQARKVILFEERFKQQDEEAWRRWLYTAVTRAEEELLIIS